MRGSTATLATAELDEPVFAETDDACRDLRLFDQAGTEVPCVVRPRRRESTVEREYDVGFIQDSFQVLPDNRIEFVLHRTNALDTPIAAVFDTPLDNFEKQVSIAGSRDGTAWEPLVANQAIFDYARYMAVRRLRVDLPPSTHAYFRIQVDNITESRASPLTQIDLDQRGAMVFSEVERRSFTRADFRIDRVRLVGRKTVSVKQERLQRAYPITDVLIKDDAERRVTTAVFTVARAPITEIAIEATTPNFIRTVTVEGRTPPASSRVEGPGPWAHLASGTLQRIRTASFHQEELTLRLPHAARVQQIRLTIHHLDSPPLVLDRLHVRGETHELVFFTDTTSTYRLCYGGAHVEAPRYDVAGALLDADATDAAVYTLSAPEPNPDYRGPRTGGWWNGRLFLVAAVLVMVAALGWALTRAAKQLAP